MATYEISYYGDDLTSYAHGLTASQAKYNHYCAVGDCFDDFKSFITNVKSVRKVSHVKGAYDFIERQYGVEFNVGDNVEIVGEGSATGKVGEVIHPSGHGAYVNVLLDGKQCLFHPMSLTTQPRKGQ
jgi:hypothetical protein